MAEKKQEAGTITLLHRLFKAANLEKFIKEDLQAVAVPSFHEYITSLCAERGEVAEHIIKRAGIERTFGHQLFNGTRKPSRDKAIQVALGFGMDTGGYPEIVAYCPEKRAVSQNRPGRRPYLLSGTSHDFHGNPGYLACSRNYIVRGSQKG